MKPYFELGDISLYLGDAREILPRLPSGLTVTDPPYNVGYGYDEYDDRLTPEAYSELLRATIRTPAVVIHYPEPMFGVAGFLGAPEKVVAWVYHANTPRQWRQVAWFGVAPDLGLDGQEYQNPDDKRIKKRIENGEQARLYDWWHIEQVKNVSAEKVRHPCQIPQALMKRILLVTPFDGPIIDPFFGSGTTLRAAKDIGRPAIGIELSEKYAEIAANRLRQEVLL